MGKLRRVTKAEDPRAWKAERYTSAPAGKYGDKRYKYVSQRQYQQTREKERAKQEKRAPELSREKRTAARERAGTTTAQAKQARESRARNRLMREYVDEGQLRRDNRLIKKYKEGGWDAIQEDDEDEEFAKLFKTYPDDEVRGWLGSSEQSRALRAHWKSTRLAA